MGPGISCNCPESTCKNDYIHETVSLILKRIKDDTGRDDKSPILKHSTEKNHIIVVKENSKINAENFINNRKEWKHCR